MYRGHLLPTRVFSIVAQIPQWILQYGSMDRQMCTYIINFNQTTSPGVISQQHSYMDTLIPGQHSRIWTLMQPVGRTLDWDILIGPYRLQLRPDCYGGPTSTGPMDLVQKKLKNYLISLAEPFEVSTTLT
jgi:hypothetical protein